MRSVLPTPRLYTTTHHNQRAASDHHKCFLVRTVPLPPSNLITPHRLIRIHVAGCPDCSDVGVLREDLASDWARVHTLCSMQTGATVKTAQTCMQHPNVSKTCVELCCSAACVRCAACWGWPEQPALCLLTRVAGVPRSATQCHAPPFLWKLSLMRSFNAKGCLLDKMKRCTCTVCSGALVQSCTCKQCRMVPSHEQTPCRPHVR